MDETVTILTYVGVILGSIIAGAAGATKLPWIRTSNNKTKNPLPQVLKSDLIEKSHKTGGAKRVSEEGLQKINDLRNTVENKYMSLDKHMDVCGRQQAEMKLFISGELKSNRETIINEIKRVGNGKKKNT